MYAENHKSRDLPFPQIMALLHPQIALCYKRKFLSHLQAATLANFESHAAQLRLLRCLGRHIFSIAVLREINSGASVIELPDGEICFLPSRKAMLARPANHIAA